MILFCLLQQFSVVAKTERNITSAQWEQLTSDKDFGYVNDVEHVKEPKQIEPGVIQKVLRGLLGFFGGSGGTFLLWMLVLGIIIFIMVKLVGNKDSFMFSRGKKKIGDVTETEDEDIAATNWEALLQQAINKNDLRMAVRYNYMWLLKLLQERDLIRYRIDKTNYEYAAELNETNYKQPFKQLSRQYEYAWYGQFAPSAAAYKEYADIFNNVKKQLGA